MHGRTMLQFFKESLSFRLLYVLFGGLFFYLVSITSDLVFIPRLEMPPGWCENWVERRIGYRTHRECVQFSDKLQELKYRHNQKMEERQKYKTFGIFLCAIGFTFLMMLLNPSKFFDQTITYDSYTGIFVVAVFYGVIIGFLLPVAFQALLPPPAEWLPNEFFEIQKARTELILQQITEMSEQTNPPI
jgi:hypothetical protein